MQYEIKFAVLSIILLFPPLIFASNDLLGQVYECKFNNGFVTDFKNINNRSEIGIQIKNTVTFSSINPISKTAVFAGQLGQTTVIFSKNIIGLHFLEITEFGNHNFTTIFFPALENGNFAIVHSRHVSFYSPLPSQSVGYCFLK